jgi:hypothetical protein
MGRNHHVKFMNFYSLTNHLFEGKDSSYRAFLYSEIFKETCVYIGSKWSVKSAYQIYLQTNGLGLTKLNINLKRTKSIEMFIVKKSLYTSETV